ncbi:MAG: hypothetical protein ACE5FJ_09375 [Gemmatimonadales bacterium]
MAPANFDQLLQLLEAVEAERSWIAGWPDRRIATKTLHDESRHPFLFSRYPIPDTR